MMLMPKRFRFAGLALVMTLGGFGTASAVQPDLTVTPQNDSQRAVRWTGLAEPAPAGSRFDTLEDLHARAGGEHRRFVARLNGARQARATITIHWNSSDDLTLTVLLSNNSVVAAADAPPGTDETLSFPVADGATYIVRVISKSGIPTEYAAGLWLRNIAGTNTGIARRLKYDKPNACGDIPKKTGKVADPLPPCYFKVKVPINIVYVGFDRQEVDLYRPETMGVLPPDANQDPRAPRIKPVVLDESLPGGRGLVAREGGEQVRELTLAEGSKIAHLPYAYEYEYRTIVADEKYSRALFAAAKAATTPGEYANAGDRAYLESYNARAAALRRTHPVAPGANVDFIDATRLEDWIATHPPKGITFDLRKPAAGYTYFVLDTYRPAYAAQYFNLDRYHHFRVMNDLTRDPDTKQQHGFDWARVWGGRYRFLMLDTGAAPNSFEGSTQHPASSYRTAFDGDSAVMDPPVWEYAGCTDPVDCGDLLPDFYRRIGENVLSAIFMRFTRSFASRPRGADRVLLASQTWHDADAYAPWPTRIDKLYDHALVARRLRELLPATSIDTSARTRFLTAEDIEQDALTDGRMQGRTRLPAADASSVDAVMRLIDTRRSSFAPVKPGTMSIPIVNVVHPKATAWSGAGPDGSVIGDLGPDPWGLLNGINDLTKAPAATGQVRDASGATHSALPDPRGNATAGQGFTAATLRNIGRVLGLFPATEGIVYSTQLPLNANEPRAHPAKPTEQYRAYYRTFDWTHATTATPMTTGWFYGKFEVLDRDALALAHSIDWLDRGLDDVSDAFAALDARGYREVPKPVVDQILRAGDYIAKSVVAAVTGNAKGAVANARIAKRETEKTVTVALRMRHVRD